MLWVIVLIFVSMLFLKTKKEQEQLQKTLINARFNYPDWLTYGIIYGVALKWTIPKEMLLAIAGIESNFDNNAIGANSEAGMFQISPALLIDFNLDTEKNWSQKDLLDSVYKGAYVAGWNLFRLRAYFVNREIAFPGDNSYMVKAYNTGIGGVNSERANLYWQKYQAMLNVIRTSIPKPIGD